MYDFLFVKQICAKELINTQLLILYTIV